MGATVAATTMKTALPALGITLALLAGSFLHTVCEAYSIDHDPYQVEKRGYRPRDSEDPRNLFAAMYGGNYKRSDPDMLQLTPEMYEYLRNTIQKRGRGLRDPYDPRHLFHSIYGGIFRKR